MKKNLKPQTSNLKPHSGYVLISVLVIMVVMLVITYYLADALFSEAAIARNQKGATIAFHLAESGVQEAIWRIRNDTDIPGAKDTFLNTTDGKTEFSHDTDALLTGGSYSVIIKNTAKAVATITATGHFSMGLKTAQRRIVVNVTKAVDPPAYDYDGAIFTGGSTGEEDITLTVTTLNVTGGGSLISNRDIWYTLSDINVDKDVIAKRNIRNVLSDVTHVLGIISENDPGTYVMPTVDVISECLVNSDSFKCRATTDPANHYYTAQQFQKLLDDQKSVTLDGIVYVAGNLGITIEREQSLTVNGVLVAEGSIDVGKPLRAGTLQINHVEGQPSGVITLGKLTCWAYSDVDITGLIYVGDRFSFDPFYGIGSQDINITGGILARRFEGRGIRTINITLNKDLINEAIPENPTTQAPVIQIQHWEEEY